LNRYFSTGPFLFPSTDFECITVWTVRQARWSSVYDTLHKPISFKGAIKSSEMVLVIKFERPSRVARWYLFKPKVQIWVNLGGSCNWRWWYILRPFGLYYGHLAYITAIWPILRPFGLFYSHLVYLISIWYILRPFCISDVHSVYLMSI
jgi:hypothetical protein